MLEGRYGDRNESGSSPTAFNVAAVGGIEAVARLQILHLKSYVGPGTTALTVSGGGFTEIAQRVGFVITAGSVNGEWQWWGWRIVPAGVAAGAATMTIGPKGNSTNVSGHHALFRGFVDSPTPFAATPVLADTIDLPVTLSTTSTALGFPLAMRHSGGRGWAGWWWDNMLTTTAWRDLTPYLVPAGAVSRVWNPNTNVGFRSIHFLGVVRAALDPVRGGITVGIGFGGSGMRTGN